MSLAWYWAVNGMASTCAAVYGIALSISMGLSTVYWVSFACYVAAVGLGIRLVRRLPRPGSEKSAVLQPREA